MRTHYRELESLLEAARELERARSEGDARLPTLLVEKATVELVYSTELHKRREQLRADIIVEKHMAREKRAARNTLEGERS